MKKKIIIFLGIIIIIILGIKFIPFGSMNYRTKEMASNLVIPRLSVFEKECCMFSANFKSFRSKYSLEKELNNIMDKYEKRTCNSKIYYYDKVNNITITDYGVKLGFLINSFYITYDKGDYGTECNNDKNDDEEINKELNEVDNVSMIIKEGTLTKVGATVIITDLNEEKYEYGEPFRIDVKESNIWKKLEITGNGAFVLPAYMVDESNQLELNQNWTNIYGELKKGIYRLVKDICVNDNCAEKKYFSVEFTIE